MIALGNDTEFRNCDREMNGLKHYGISDTRKTYLLSTLICFGALSFHLTVYK